MLDVATRRRKFEENAMIFCEKDKLILPNTTNLFTVQLLSITWS